MKGRPLISSLEDQPADLRSAPPRWRAFLPAWVRGLIWVEQSTSFAAFLSYSWKGESAIAPIIQSVIQMFLRPWYKPRALNIFRDLSSLAAGSSLQESLQQKLDQSQHLIVLASSKAAASAGMEFEANYWFSKDRDGAVLIIVTEPGAPTWEDVRSRLLPPSVRRHLASPPLWVDLSAQCSRIREKPSDYDKGQITEALSQLILAFYPGQTWPALRGEERHLRTRALSLVWSAIAALSLTTGVAILKAVEATRQLGLAENRLTDLISAEGRRSLIGNDYERALLFLSEAYARRPDDDAIQFMSVAAIRNAARSLRTNEVGERIDFLTFSPDSKRVLTVADGPSQVWISDVETGSPLVRLQTPRIVFPPRPHVQTPMIKNDLTLMGAMNGPLASLFDSASYQRPFLSVLGARFFARGTRVLTWGGELAIYDAQTGRRLADFPLQGLSWIRGAELDRAERMLLTYDDESAVVVWDVKSRKMLRSLDIDRPRNAAAPVVAVFDPTGHRIVAVAGGSKIRIWNTDRLDAPSTVLESGAGKVVWAEFAPPDGDRLVTASENGPAQLWDLSRSNSQPLSLDSKSGDSISRARFTGDGQRIVTTGGNNVGIWGGFTAPLLHVLRGHTCDVDNVDLSPDGSRLLTACSIGDASALLWNVETGDLIGTFRVAEDDTPGTARFSPDGTKIATGSGFGRFNGRVWPARHDTLRFEKVEPEPGSVFLEEAHLTADARAIVRVTDEVIETTSIESGKTLSRIKLPYGPSAASFRASGKAAVIASSDFRRRATFDAIDPATGRIVSSHAATIPGKIETLSFSPDEKLVGVVARNYSPDAHAIELWESDPWKRRCAITPPNEPSSVAEVVWSPDSAFFALELDDNTVLVMNARTGSILRNLPGQYPAFTGDSTRLALVSSSVEERNFGRVEVTVHDLRGNGAPLVLRDREHPHEDWINDIAFNTEGTQVATGSQDQTVKLWDLKTGALLATLGEDPVIGGRKQPYVTDVAYSPDGKLLASADDEGGVRIWDARQHVLLFRMTDLYGSEAFFKKFEFTPDGKSLLLVGDDWFGAFETGLSKPEPAFVRAAASRLVSARIRAVVPLGRDLTGEATPTASETRTPTSPSGPPATAPASEEFTAVTELVAAIVQSLQTLTEEARTNAERRSQTKDLSMTCAEMAEAKRVVNDIMMFGTTVTADRLAEEQTAWTAEFRAIARQSDLPAGAKRNLADRAGRLQQLIEQALKKAVAAAKLAQERAQEHVAASAKPGSSCAQTAAYLYHGVTVGSLEQRRIEAARLQTLVELLRNVLRPSHSTPAAGPFVRSPRMERQSTPP